MPVLEIRNGRRIIVGSRSGISMYSNRLDLDDDFEVIISHDASISATGRLVQAPPSPQKGRTTWVMGDTWSMPDDTEIFLDPSDKWYDEELRGEVYESCVFQQAKRENPGKKQRWRRTKVSLVRRVALTLWGFRCFDVETAFLTTWSARRARWNGSHFEPMTLKDIGLHVQLNLLDK
ncbi:hypothetical protein ARMSODRAFT_979728 [Armillaria solidipes]|uniref:Uncharacterized protein n=1 Tax=Armillaria solidipes TaxID=1076256 RepID=A0A2H3AY42_9AGAR|nr:hypothetical protein ARMSODRAFT_979728 [Armillaria solidipes]